MAPATPLVSIVTPTLNMVRFLEEAIESVLAQDYPNLEYIVMDGGSTDGTLDLLRRYEGRLLWESQPDRGQCDAINRGFLRSTGSIFAFLCADDIYLPGAVSTAVRHLQAHPEHGGVYGEGYLIDESGNTIRRYPTEAWDPERLKFECFICQPSAFVRSEVFAGIGMLDPELHQSLDYDLWIRLAKHHSLLKVDEYLSGSRMHVGSKTIYQRRAVYKAAIRVLKRHYGYAPFPNIYSYACSLLDSRDGFFDPVPPSPSKFLLSVAYGSWANFRSLGRFWKEAFRAGIDAIQRGAWPRSPKQPGASV